MSLLWSRDFVPLGIFVLFFLGTLALIFVFAPKRERKRSALLLRHFQGKYVYPLGTLEIPFSGAIFRVMRMARGAGTYNSVGGSYATLWTYTAKAPKFIIGNATSGKYTFGNFLILPPHETVTIHGVQFLLGSKSQELQDRAKMLLQENSDLAQRLSRLFEKDWAHLSIATENHLRGFSIQRKSVLRYMTLPEEMYQQPEILEPILQTISEFVDKLGISFDPS